MQPPTDDTEHDLNESLKKFKQELNQFMAVICDRLDILEQSVADAEKAARGAKSGSQYNYMLLGAIALLLVAILMNVLPVRWQAAFNPELVSKNLTGIGKVIQDLTNVLQVAASLGAGAIAWKAHSLKGKP